MEEIKINNIQYVVNAITGDYLKFITDDKTFMTNVPIDLFIKILKLLGYKITKEY